MTRQLDRMDEGLRNLLARRTGTAARLVLLALSAAVFYLFACHARYASIDEVYGGDPVPLQRFTALVYTAIFAFSFAVQLPRSSTGWKPDNPFFSRSSERALSCCMARTSVGAISALWNPFCAAIIMARKARIVFPLPTSP